MTDPFAEDLARKGMADGAGEADPFAADLKRKGLIARHERNVKEIRMLKADPENTAGDYANAVGGAFMEKLKGMGRGALALENAALHPIDTVTDPSKRRELERGVDDMVTLGYGQQFADWAGRKLGDTPEQQLGATAAADAQAAPGYRTAGNLAGAVAPGAVGAIGGAAAKAAKAVLPAAKAAGVVGGAGRAALTYELAAPVTAGLHAGSAGHRLEAAQETAQDPGNVLMAIGAGAAGGRLAGAPARAEKSELAGLTTGVQYKSRVQRFVPNEQQIASELRQTPQIRSLIKTDPVKAQAAVDGRLGAVADDALNPFFRQMAANGTDQMPVNLVTDQLKAVRAGFNKVTEKGQIAAIDDYIAGFESEAAQNGGRLPAQFVRESATSVQKQGHANTSMFGPVPLTKEMKQDVGAALRNSIADHVESLAPSNASGKALRDAFTSANKQVSTWYAIKNLVDEKANRIKGNATPMGDIVHAVGGAINHPIKTALGMVPGVADAVNRRVVAPLARSAAGQEVIGGLEGAGQTRPIMSPPPAMPANPVMTAYEAERERKRRLTEQLRNGGGR